MRRRRWCWYVFSERSQLGARSLFNLFSLGGLLCWLRLRVWGHQGAHTIHLSWTQAENLPVQVGRLWNLQ